MLAHAEKTENQVEERYEDLNNDSEIESLIDDAKIRIKVARLTEKVEQSSERMTYTNF